MPEFVVHIVSDAIRDKMNVCAVDFPAGVNEIAEAGFTAMPSRKVRSPRIAEAPIAFEYKLMQMVDIGRMPYHLVTGGGAFSLPFRSHQRALPRRLSPRKFDRASRGQGRLHAHH